MVNTDLTKDIRFRHEQNPFYFEDYFHCSIEKAREKEKNLLF